MGVGFHTLFSVYLLENWSYILPGPMARSSMIVASSGFQEGKYFTLKGDRNSAGTYFNEFTLVSEKLDP